MSNSKDRKKYFGNIYICTAFLFCLPMAVFESGDISDVYLYITYTVATIFIIQYLRYVNSISTGFLLANFYPIYSFIGLLVSSAIVSFEVPMIEIQQKGFPNGTFWILLLFFILGLESSRASFKTYINKRVHNPVQKLNSKITNLAIYGVIFISLSVALVILVRYSAPIFIGVNRVAYWRDVIPSYLGIFASMFSQSFFFCAYLYLKNKYINKRTKFLLFVIALYIFFSVTILGEKFSVFIFYLTIFFMISAGFSLIQKISLWHILSGVALLFVLLILIGVNYVHEDQEAIFILSRIATQSQVIWSVLNEDILVIIAGANWSCFFGCDSFESGEDYISSRYMTDSLFDGYKESGAGLTGFMPALPILLWGVPIALVMHCAFSYFLGYVQAKLLIYIRLQNFIYSLLIWKIYLGIIMLWFAAKIIAIPGLIVAGLLILIYSVLLARKTQRQIFSKDI